MSTGTRYTNPHAEEMRLRSLYRQAAIRGQLRGVPLKVLQTFTGPDCAYHLYSTKGPNRDTIKRKGT